MNEKLKCQHFDIADRESEILNVDFDELVPAVEHTDEELAYASKQKERQGMDVMPLALYEELLENCLARGDYRSALWFVLMANFGLRYSDVVKLRRADFIDEHNQIRDSILIQEKKTDKQRIVYVNKAVKEMLLMFLWNSDVKPLDYLITSNANRKGYEMETYVNEKGQTRALRVNGKIVYKLDKDGNRIPKPLSREQSEIIMKDALRQAGVKLGNDGLKLCTHSLRKLYGWAITNDYVQNFDADEAYAHTAALGFLCQDYGHSSEAMTLRYSKDFEGLKREIVMRMNLGLRVVEPYFKVELEKYQSR